MPQASGTGNLDANQLICSRGTLGSHRRRSASGIARATPEGADTEPNAENSTMSKSRLDRGTKIYIGILVGIALAILIA